MQTKQGEDPLHLVSEEFSEWMRLRAIPAMNRAAELHFVPGRHTWFSGAKYNKLKQALDWPAEKPCFLISQDNDNRHQFTDMWYVREQQRKNAKKRDGKRHSVKRRDRRDLAPKQRGWVDLDRRQYVPSAPKVPDCIQQPIECFFGGLKRRFREHYKLKENGWRSMVESILYVWETWAEKQELHKYWRHAKTALKVFSGLPNETVTVGNREVLCTPGDWVQRSVRG